MGVKATGRVVRVWDWFAPWLCACVVLVMLVVVGAFYVFALFDFTWVEACVASACMVLSGAWGFYVGWRRS